MTFSNVLLANIHTNIIDTSIDVADNLDAFRSGRVRVTVRPAITLFAVFAQAFRSCSSGPGTDNKHHTITDTQ